MLKSIPGVQGEHRDRISPCQHIKAFPTSRTPWSIYLAPPSVRIGCWVLRKTAKEKKLCEHKNLLDTTAARSAVHAKPEPPWEAGQTWPVLTKEQPLSFVMDSFRSSWATSRRNEPFKTGTSCLSPCESSSKVQKAFMGTFSLPVVISAWRLKWNILSCLLHMKGQHMVALVTLLLHKQGSTAY